MVGVDGKAVAQGAVEAKGVVKGVAKGVQAKAEAKADSASVVCVDGADGADGADGVGGVGDGCAGDGYEDDGHGDDAHGNSCRTPGRMRSHHPCRRLHHSFCLRSSCSM